MDKQLEEIEAAVAAYRIAHPEPAKEEKPASQATKTKPITTTEYIKGITEAVFTAAIGIPFCLLALWGMYHGVCFVLGKVLGTVVSYSK